MGTPALLCWHFFFFLIIYFPGHTRNIFTEHVTVRCSPAQLDLSEQAEIQAALSPVSAGEGETASPGVRGCRGVSPVWTALLLPNTPGPLSWPPSQGRFSALSRSSMGSS